MDRNDDTARQTDAADGLQPPLAGEVVRPVLRTLSTRVVLVALLFTITWVGMASAPNAIRWYRRIAYEPHGGPVTVERTAFGYSVRAGSRAILAGQLTINGVDVGDIPEGQTGTFRGYHKRYSWLPGAPSIVVAVD